MHPATDLFSYIYITDTSKSECDPEACAHIDHADKSFFTYFFRKIKRTSFCMDRNIIDCRFGSDHIPAELKKQVSSQRKPETCTTRKPECTG